MSLFTASLNSERKVGKQKTIEYAIQTLIVELLAKHNNSELSLEEIWNALPSHIPGRFNPQNSNEYQTIEYGSLHRNTLSQKIESRDMLGASRKRRSNGSTIAFDGNKVKEFKMTQGIESQNKDKADPGAMNIEPKNDYAKSIEDESEVSVGSVSSEGFRACGFIFEEEIQE